MRKLEREDQPVNAAERRRAAAAVDLTVRKQAEKTPETTDENYRMLVENSPDLIARFDTRRRHLYVNPAAARAGKLSASEYTGLTIAESGVPEPAATAWDQRLGEVLRTGRTLDVEDAFPTPEGIRYFHTVFAPELTPDGSVSSVLSVARDITARKQAEAALRESEARKSAMLGSALDCIVAVDSEGNLTEFNHAAETTFGYRREDVIGKKMASLLIPPALRDAHRAGVMRYKATGQSAYLGSALELRAMRADGTEFPVALAVVPLTAPGVTGFLGVIRDVTERQRAEEAVRDLSKFPSEDPNPVLRIARDGTLLYSNEAGLSLLPQWHLQVGQASPPMLREIVVRSMDNGSTEELDLEHGERVYAFGVVPVVAAGYTNLYGRDITERKLAERALKESETKYRTLIEQAWDGIFVVDQGGKILLVNEQACLMLGYTQAELMQLNMADTYSADGIATLAERIASAQRGEHLVYERFMVRKDGTTCPIEVSIDMLPNGSIQGIVRDITERKRAEDALRNREDMLQRIFDVLPVGLWFADKDGKLLRGNPAGVKIWGAEPRVNLSGVGIFKARRLPSGEELAPDDWALVHTIRDKVTIVDELLEIDAFDGEKKTILNFSAPVLDAQGEVQGAIVVNEDITERRRAEQRMRLFSQEIIAAREEERKQVSAVLHHDVGSLAVGISAHLDAIEEELRSGKPGEALKWMKRTRKLFDGSVVHLKGLAVQLRPPELDVLGLRAALRQHFSQATKHRGTMIHFRENLGRRRVAGDTVTILFRVAQEALTNAITHGHAKRVDVDLRALKKEIRLTVRDNGKGFDPSELLPREKSQLGLRVMQEMVVFAGGVFACESGRKKGTTVRVRLPFTAAKRGGA